MPEIAHKGLGHLYEYGQCVRCEADAFKEYESGNKATLPDIVQRLRGPIAHSFTTPRNEEAIKDCLFAAHEIERLRAFRNRIVGFFNELHEESKDGDGRRMPYMLYGDDADVLERFETVIGDDHG